MNTTRSERLTTCIDAIGCGLFVVAAVLLFSLFGIFLFGAMGVA